MPLVDNNHNKKQNTQLHYLEKIPSSHYKVGQPMFY